MNNLTDVDAFTHPVAVPGPTDAANQGTMAAVMQPLADRTRYLGNRLFVRGDPNYMFASNPGTPGGGLPPAAHSALWSGVNINLALNDYVDLSAFADLKSTDHLLYLYWKIAYPDSSVHYLGGVYRSTDGNLHSGCLFQASLAGVHTFELDMGGSDGSVALATNSTWWAKAVKLQYPPTMPSNP